MGDDKIPKDVLKLGGILSRESGVPLDNIVGDLSDKMQRVQGMRKSAEGKM